MSAKYTFPFNSCEIPNKKGIAQPYSAVINLVLTLIVSYFVFYSDNIYSKLFLSMVLIFNISHTFSHSIHLEKFGNLHFLLSHYSAIISTVFLLLLLNKITKTIPPTFIVYLLVGLYLIDSIFILCDVSHIYNIAVFLLILILIICFYYNLLPKVIKHNIQYIVFFSLLAFIFQLFEIYNCNKILEEYPNFPFHIIVEMTVFFPVLLICKSFYKVTV